MMSSEYRLPALPLGGSEVTIVRWLKKPGDQVAAGDALVIVLGERAEVALPARASGVLTRLLLAEGQAAAVGTPLAELASADFAPAEQAAPATASIGPALPPVRVTPVARRIAVATGIDIGSLAGSGASGWVVKADVLAALPPPAEILTLPQSETHQDAQVAPHTLARVFVHSGVDTQVLTAIDVDAEGIGAARERLQPGFARRGLLLTDTLCVLAGVVAALARHPLLNSIWHEDAIAVRRRLDLALLAGGRTVLVPGAQDLNLRGLARALQRGLLAAAEDGAFAVVEYAGPISWGQPALPARTSAALGVGAACARPVVEARHGVDQVVVRRTMILSLAYDARVLDQCYADAFLRDLKQYLEHFDTYPGV